MDFLHHWSFFNLLTRVAVGVAVGVVATTSSNAIADIIDGNLVAVVVFDDVIRGCCCVWQTGFLVDVETTTTLAIVIISRQRNVSRHN